MREQGTRKGEHETDKMAPTNIEYRDKCQYLESHPYTDHPPDKSCHPTSNPDTNPQKSLYSLLTAASIPSSKQYVVHSEEINRICVCE